MPLSFAMTDRMGEEHVGEGIQSPVAEVDQAREDFRVALVAANKTRNAARQLEEAVAAFCHGSRLLGRSPERVIVDAKQVIEEAIDGDNAILASRAVSSCIQHYFRD